MDAILGLLFVGETQGKHFARFHTKLTNYLAHQPISNCSDLLGYTAHLGEPADMDVWQKGSLGNVHPNI